MKLRIVAMLTRMVVNFDDVAESSAEYIAGIDYEDEHRFAEHEHEHEEGRKPKIM